MVFSPFFRKLGLTVHITFSVGWFGAVAAFLALAIAGLTSQNQQIVVSSYLSMDLIAWFVILPACIASLLSGVLQSLCTQWGLFRYYWVVAKFALTIIATIVLILHMQPISYMANVVWGSVLSESELRGLRVQLIADAGAAMLVLLIAATLSVYKPWGITAYGKSWMIQQQKKIAKANKKGKKPWILYLLLALIVLVILMFILMHITGGELVKH
jgi:hypothetical protein